MPQAEQSSQTTDDIFTADPPATPSQTPETPADSAPPAEKPRDPKTGRFLKADGQPEPHPADDPQNWSMSDAKSAETPSEPQQPKHDAHLVEAAKHFGFTDEEIAETPSDRLNAMVWRLYRSEERVKQQFEQQRAAEQAKQQPAATEPEPEQDELGLGELANELHPGLHKALKTLADRNKELSQKFSQKVQADEQREQQSVNDQIDAAFDVLGEKHAKVYGSGSFDDLTKANPAALKRRIAVLQAAGVDPKALPPHRILIKKLAAAHQELFGFEAPPPAAEEPEAGYESAIANGKGKKRISEEQWNKSGLARPTQRVSEDLPEGEERATKNLAKKLGVEPSTIRNPVEFSDFPG